MDTHRTYTTKSPEETAAVASVLARELGEEGALRIVCLYGELGSGKTTFTQAFAKALGISTRLLSPTFIVERQYETPDHEYLYHFDLYRLESSDQIKGIGVAERMGQMGVYVLIEWAERLGTLLPKERVDIHFETLEDGRHTITIESNL